jgi:hypothetical protein
LSTEALIDKMMNLGVDHHMMLALGDITNELTEFCKMVRIQSITLA